MFEKREQKRCDDQKKSLKIDIKRNEDAKMYAKGECEQRENTSRKNKKKNKKSDRVSVCRKDGFLKRLIESNKFD